MATKVNETRYRSQVLISRPGEPRKYKSFYGKTADEADYNALAFKLGKTKDPREAEKMTVAQAVERYIDLRRPVLSPSTIRGYAAILRDYISPGFGALTIGSLTYPDLQTEANRLATSKSVKTAKNTVSLVVSAIRVYAPEKTIRPVVYPKAPPKEYGTPDGETLKKIFAAAEGTWNEVPVLLAAWLSLRASEIAGLKWTDVKGDTLDINEARIAGEYGQVSKEPKTKGSRRKIPLPAFIKEKILALPKKGKHIFEGTSSQVIGQRYHEMLIRNGLPLSRFHDLRHANASIMLMLGIPDKYAMERGGWSSTNVLKGVYQQTFAEEQRAVAARIDSYFLSLFAPEKQAMQH